MNATLVRAAAAPPVRRSCLRCGCRLSLRADPRDAYCAPCHPTLERPAGATLRAARAGGSSSEATIAAHELAERRWRRA
jgi:hypothetical protein